MKKKMSNGINYLIKFSRSHFNIICRASFIVLNTLQNLEETSSIQLYVLDILLLYLLAY